VGPPRKRRIFYAWPGDKRKDVASLDGPRRVHPFGALFLFGDKQVKIYPCNLDQIGGDR